jgi:hypothetical protein
MKKLLFACAVAGLLVAPAAQAQDGAVFRPVGGWTADFGDDYCRLVRTFSDGQDEVSLALERTQPGAFLKILLVGNGISTFRGADQIGYTLLPSGSERETRYVRSETAEGKQFLSFDALTLAPFAFTPGTPPAPYRRDAELETARGINAVALDKGLTDPVRFETGSLRAPVEVMQACADDLLVVWGLDVEKHKTLTATPIPNPVQGGVLPQGTIPFTEFAKMGGGLNQVIRHRCRRRSTGASAIWPWSARRSNRPRMRTGRRWQASGWARRCSSARRGPAGAVLAAARRPGR